VQTLNRLTAKAVENLRQPGRHADGGGLHLVITAAVKGNFGTRSINGRRWIFRYKLAGREREMGLGSARSVSLAKARELAAGARELLAQGVDPLDARRQAEVAAEAARAAAEEEAAADQRAAVTFGQCADELIKSMSPAWRNAKHAAQWPSTLETYAATLRGMSVAAIDTESVLACLRPIWTAKPETASRVRGRIEKVLDYARANGLRSGENPARWRGHLDQILPARKKLTRGHHAAAPYTLLPDLMRQLGEREAIAARALEFLILTASRSSEVFGARWSEIDLSRSIWTIPGARMKAGREHRVPLSDGATAVLKRMQAVTHGSYVFPSQGRRSIADAPLSSMSLQMLMRRMKLDFTPHGFRSSFRDWSAEETQIANIVAEAALAHVVADKAEAAYRRGDLFKRRRELMEAWARYCLPTAQPANAGLLPANDNRAAA